MLVMVVALPGGARGYFAARGAGEAEKVRTALCAFPLLDAAARTLDLCAHMLVDVCVRMVCVPLATRAQWLNGLFGASRLPSAGPSTAQCADCTVGIVWPHIVTKGLCSGVGCWPFLFCCNMVQGLHACLLCA